MRAKNKIEVWSNYVNLTYFRSAYKLNYQQVHWRLKLTDYDFILLYKLEKAISKVDLLSQRVDYNTSKYDNKNVIFIKDEWLV